MCIKQSKKQHREINANPLPLEILSVNIRLILKLTYEKSRTNDPLPCL